MLQFWVLVEHNADVDVLTQVVRDIEALGGRRLHEHLFVVDALRARCDLLQLFTSQFNITVLDLLLGHRLRFKLLLDNSVDYLVLSRSNSGQAGIRRLILSDRLFYVEVVHVLNQIELLCMVRRIHPEVRILP